MFLGAGFGFFPQRISARANDGLLLKMPKKIITRNGVVGYTMEERVLHAVAWGDGWDSQGNGEPRSTNPYESARRVETPEMEADRKIKSEHWLRGWDSRRNLRLPIGRTKRSGDLD